MGLIMELYNLFIGDDICEKPKSKPVVYGKMKDPNIKCHGKYGEFLIYGGVPDAINCCKHCKRYVGSQNPMELKVYPLVELKECPRFYPAWLDIDGKPLK